MTEKKSKRGRPTEYTKELADLICERVATYDVGLQKICALYNDMPCRKTIHNWRLKFPAFKKRYEQAKMFQVEILLDEMLEITEGIPVYIDAHGHARCNPWLITIAQLKIDVIKWHVSKLAIRT